MVFQLIQVQFQHPAQKLAQGAQDLCCAPSTVLHCSTTAVTPGLGTTMIDLTVL